jgi:hypothetical protein
MTFQSEGRIGYGVIIQAEMSNEDEIFWANKESPSRNQ